MNKNNDLRVMGTLLLALFLLLPSCRAAMQQTVLSSPERQCVRRGWEAIALNAGGFERSLLWKRPRGPWRYGAIIVLHGGGGSHHNFCRGGRLVQPQIEFAKLAVSQGFAIFLLDSTDDVVVDANERECGKRFDFSVLNRPNVDLPFIEKVITQVIPRLRPIGSSAELFLSGLSTGGYMTIRAATHFDDKITAFAPVSAGDPYGTEVNCDASLSPRKSAKGILVDSETEKKITEINACFARAYPNEKTWETREPARKPSFKQFHHEGDGIVDISCMKKAQILLERHGYVNSGEYVINSSRRRALNHLWLKRYNQPILDFFKSEQR